jgi:diguanylate cyclase (GGDEF)-like protein/PAS domain S-box-containing protein
MSLFNLSPEDLRGTNIFEGLDAENAGRVRDAFARLKTGSKSEKLIIRRELPGKSIWIETTFSQPANSDANREMGIVAVTRDVTRHKKVQDELLAIARTDSLTGLANRRAFDDHLGRITRGGGNGNPVSLIMIDIDRFKLYNDTYGHHEGDLCLRAVAKAVSGCVATSTDMVARYGGEEIVAILSGTDADGAFRLAETIRERVEALGIDHAANGPWEKVTISLGVATVGSGDSHHQDLFERADRALYEAKNSGRNRVHVLTNAKDSVGAVAVNPVK